MQKGRIIGKGKTAEVFELGTDKVLKLYFETTGEGFSEYEAGIGRTVYEAGVAAPQVFEYMNTQGRQGVIFEKATGYSLFSAIERHPWNIKRYAKEMAGFHARMHRSSSTKLASQYEVIKNKIGLSEELLGEKAAVIYRHLSELPDGPSICHGDLHPKNIFTCSGSPIAIDWADAYYGDRAGDVARTCLVLSSPHMPSGTSFFLTLIMKSLKRSMLRNYLREYIKLTGIRKEDIDSWLLPVAAARIKEDISGEKEWLMKIIDRQLKERYPTGTQTRIFVNDGATG